MHATLPNFITNTVYFAALVTVIEPDEKEPSHNNLLNGKFYFCEVNGLNIATPFVDPSALYIFKPFFTYKALF